MKREAERHVGQLRISSNVSPRTLMKNAIHPSQKDYFIKKGKNHAFGKDFEARESMSSATAAQRFDEVWENELKKRIEQAVEVDSEDVKMRLGEAARSFVKSSSTHREFRFGEALWIAQISKDENDQLWIVPKREYDTRSITATFKTQDERDAFDSLASKHGIQAQEYARRILSAHLSIYRD